MVRLMARRAETGASTTPEPGMCRPTLLQGTLGSTVTTEKSPSSLTTTCFPPK
jgi:hypothetical protein